MLDNVIVFRQNSIKISKDKIIYFDPFKIDDKFNDADIIFITHDHYDHYDVESIKNIKNNNTFIVIPTSLLEEAKKLFNEDKIVVVTPSNEYVIDSISFKTVPSYNINKAFHPKSNNWVGYVVNIDNNIYYVMGDTDAISEAENVKCDVLFIPIGGTYTMDYEEASNLANIIKPKIAVPVHYGSIVGSLDDGNKFINNLDSNIKGELLIK
jgi:L-ascorbate metabolism protein UlaG (beta-lactamase superfamily)